MQNPDKFQFLDPGHLQDRELTAKVAAHHPADSIKGWVPAYQFELHRDGVDEPVGHINLRIGQSCSLEMYAGHIGYGITPQWRGNHYAERGVRLLLPLIKQHGLTTLWITCNPDNWASRHTCERLGAKLVEIVPLPEENEMYLKGDREKCHYRLELTNT